MITTVNGVPINIVEIGKKDAMPVVFLHGFPFNHQMWANQLEVVGKVYRAIAYDIRGHGESFVGDGQFTIEGHVDDLIAILDHLQLRKTVIVGLSMGGYITLRALERNPERFSAAVMCDMRSEADSNEAKLRRFESAASVKKYGSVPFADTFSKGVFDPETLTTKPEVVATIKKVIAATPPLSIAGTLLALASRTDMTHSLPAIKVPTLIMVGEHDQTTPPSSAKAVHEKIPGSELSLVPHAAHMSNLENPEFFNDRLMKFLQKVAAQMR